jgi:hypothetical protein
MTVTKTGTISGEEIFSMIAEKLNAKIENIFIDIKETGDVDCGTYNRELRAIEFEIIEIEGK